MNLVRHETRREVNDTLDLDDSTGGRAVMMITMLRSRGTLRSKKNEKSNQRAGFLNRKYTWILHAGVRHLEPFMTEYCMIGITSYSLYSIYLTSLAEPA